MTMHLHEFSSIMDLEKKKAGRIPQDPASLDASLNSTYFPSITSPCSTNQPLTETGFLPSILSTKSFLAHTTSFSPSYPKKVPQIVPAHIPHAAVLFPKRLFARLRRDGFVPIPRSSAPRHPSTASNPSRCSSCGIGQCGDGYLGERDDQLPL